MTALITATFLLLAASAFAARPTASRTLATEITRTWTCQTQLGVPRTPARVNPWALAKHSAGYRAWILNRWTLRHQRCVAVLHERARQWNWQAWLPDNWYRVGSCETGYGGPPNWFHANSSYVSAFGISVQEYDRDAAYMGVRPWYVKGQPPPTPWEQYQAALGHYKRFGDGWGCPGP